MSQNHAKHNKEACEYIKDSGKFNDWVVTTAYYSALHFMQNELFPDHYEHPINGEIKRYNTFQNYFQDSDKKLSKHGLLLELVEENVDDDDVINGFRSLKELCWTARYRQYQFNPAIANECYDNLELVSEYCSEIDLSK